MKVGAQLYTVRDACRTLEDFSETLKKIADIGYRSVQISGTCAYEPQWLAGQLEAAGLVCVLTHTAAGRLLNEPVKVAQDHDVFGCQYVGLGYHAFEEAKHSSDIDAFIAEYAGTVRTLHEHGKYFMYHNHDGECRHVDGKPILEWLAEKWKPEDVGFTLDTFWIQAGGGDPAWWIEHLAGRVPCIHLKDFAYGRKMAVIGEGNINFDRVFEKAEAAGTAYMLVEQDDCNGEDPFECLRRSYQNLNAFGFR